ncbi:MAG: protein-export chaperone SecB [Shimia sp.]
MTDTPDPQTDAAPAAGQPQQNVNMRILGQFVRDLSFENILVRKGVTGEVEPEVQVQVNLDGNKRGENRYEVVVKLKVSSKNKADKADLFLMEMEYGGLFHIEGVAEEQLHPFLMIECPRQLFPFIRRVVSDVTRDGGFPPLNLETIDFLALYRAELTRRMEAQKAASPTN